MTINKNMHINIITLGCSKNLVDSEYLLRQFRANGHTVSHDQHDIEADVIILNTCGFILDAKEESVNSILYHTERKKQGKTAKVYVMGCLSERYRSELEREIPEVDGFYGVWDHEKIVQEVGASYYPELANDRLVTTPGHYAFLKISEGCNRRCSFCAIPGIRGKQRSKTQSDLVREASNLAGRGTKELILIAQDLTSYGTDLSGKKELPELLRQLTGINGIEWIRMHYAYPTGFPEQVIDLMAEQPGICNYLDIPIQHISDGVLKSMNRGHSGDMLKDLLEKLRNKVKDVAIRTTVMVGYPGETESDFQELYDYVKTFRFDRLGVFPYSHEEDTPAAGRTDDIPEHVKHERADRIMQLQQQISLELNEAKIGREYRVIVDREEADYFIARTEYDSPEVDNEVLIQKPARLIPGEFTKVRITGAGEFDLYGEVTG